VLDEGGLTTSACKMLGIVLPIVQAPIGSATTPALAAAVSDAGGLGTLALSWTDLAVTAEAIRATSRLTTRPFAVNLVLAWPQHERLTVCADEGVRVVSTFWGDPAPYVGAVHDAGALHVHAVGSVAEAVAAVEAGVDIVVAQGWEAGGHVRGQVGALALVPSIVDAVHPVPVLAAGGIADGRGLAAALLLGAQGAWVGTRFLLADEADVHEEYRQRLLHAVAGDTIISQIFDGGWSDAPHRALRNSTTAAWEIAGRPSAPERPGEHDVVARSATGGPLRRYGDDIPTRATTGNVEALAHYPAKP
jgi:NAD(P)H-dependent flavin oxidoreductase YrpB (nitropropane dioxygenase family)